MYNGEPKESQGTKVSSKNAIYNCPNQISKVEHYKVINNNCPEHNISFQSKKKNLGKQEKE